MRMGKMKGPSQNGSYFRDSDASDDDYEEVEMQAEEDYDEEDDYLLAENQLLLCKRSLRQQLECKSIRRCIGKIPNPEYAIVFIFCLDAHLCFTLHRYEVHTSGKPRMIKDYNSSKFGVDIFDEMLGSNSYRPQSSVGRCESLWHSLSEVLQSMPTYSMVESSRREFTNKLADQLMEGQKERRSNDGHWTTKVFVEISGLYKG
uniref:PiggyBac transposable element-derived protein domain-containing protein n=1 Tax=Ditylenchus dipsaci TaxID=166011 RepID=A0A915DG81_9BILA